MKGIFTMLTTTRSAVVLVMVVSGAAADQLRDYRLVPATNQETSKLVAVVDGREVNVATDVLKVWRGWIPDILLYVEKLSDGRQRLRSFNAIVGRRDTITTEQQQITSVTSAQLDRDHQVLVIFLRDQSGKVPSLALAGPQSGVFRRYDNATAGAILDKRIEIRYFAPEDLDRPRDDFQDLKPAKTEIVPLMNPRR
jgi:hypothetical protein